MEDCKLVACQLENNLEQKNVVVVAYIPSSDTCLQLCKVFLILYQFFYLLLRTVEIQYLISLKKTTFGKHLVLLMNTSL